MVQVKFGTTSADVGFITTGTAQQSLSIEWVADLDSLYTVIMFDMDTPYPAPNNVNSPFLHLLITNIKGMDIAKGDSLIEYMPPSPPADSLPHAYNLDVYLQKNSIRPVQHTVRKNFNLMGFVERHNLTLVDRSSFKVGQIVPTPSVVARIPSSVSMMIVPSLEDRKPETTNYFLPGSDLTDKQKSWCRCVLHVANRQRGACNIERKWTEGRRKECVNPYAICSASVGTSVRTCGANYDFGSISDDELITYSELHQKSKDGIIIEIPDPYNRETMLANIKRWKELKGKK